MRKHYKDTREALSLCYIYHLLFLLKTGCIVSVAERRRYLKKLTCECTLSELRKYDSYAQDLVYWRDITTRLYHAQHLV